MPAENVYTYIPLDIKHTNTYIYIYIYIHIIIVIILHVKQSNLITGQRR